MTPVGPGTRSRAAFVRSVLAFALLAIAALPALAREPVPRVAVISAFPPEAGPILAMLDAKAVTTINGIEVTTGRMAGHEVVFALSGISMVNAAMTTQLLLERFTVRAIVVSGIAGGVDPALGIGDVVVPARWGQYLEAVFARETQAGYAPPGWASSPYPNYGMIFPQPVVVRRDGDTDGTGRFWFDVDPEMLVAARASAPDTVLPRCTADGACLDRAPRLEIGGNGVSGQAFVDNAAFREYAHKTFDADVLDMETAAIATVAFANRVRFLAFRSLSDLAGGGPGENEMETFMQLAAGNSAAVLKAFLEAWPPSSPQRQRTGP